ncbi:MAG: matrixin family metalloprotease [Candidatus Acidiferrales bacterium]
MNGANRRPRAAVGQTSWSVLSSYKSRRGQTGRSALSRVRARLGQTGRSVLRIALSVLLATSCAWQEASAYTLNRTVTDMRVAANAGLGACPQLNRFDTQTPGKLIDRRWNTTFGANIRTTATLAADRVNEVRQSVIASFAAWTSVASAALGPALDPTLNETTQMPSCASNDGLNTICFAQSDAGFSPGVLAFTNTVTSDILGEQFPASSPSVFVGEILDADVLFNPTVTFATPSALNFSAFDLESVLIHELGHAFGFSHSGVWGAIMYPFAPLPGQFAGSRPTATAPDAPLSDDDRAGLRVLYPDANDTLHTGSIRGRIVPVNPLSLAGQPTGVTGIFGAHVVAIDDVTGAVAGATLAGWSCSDPGPPVFDGSYAIERLPVGRSYRVFVEPLDGPVDSGNVSNSIQSLCRNNTTDPGWPAQFACTVPPVNTTFTTRAKGQ